MTICIAIVEIHPKIMKPMLKTEMASNAIFKYINSKFSRARCVTKTCEVSFLTNSSFADLIKWYSLYFGLIFKFKMAVQNGCQRHIENLKK